MSEVPRVVAIGDSLIYGRLDTQRGGWISHVRDWLDQDGPEGSALFNLGIGGNTAKAVHDRAVVELPPRTPNGVIVGAGTNDLRRPEGPTKAHELRPELYEANVRAVLRFARDLGAKIAVAGLIPVDESKTTPHQGEYWYSNADVREYDDILRMVAAEEAARYIDLAPAFCADGQLEGPIRDELFADGIHPNPDGHAAMFTLARPILADWLGL